MQMAQLMKQLQDLKTGQVRNRQAANPEEDCQLLPDLQISTMLEGIDDRCRAVGASAASE